MTGFLRRRKLSAIRARPFPDAWRAIVARSVHLYAQLTPEERAELEGDVQVFLAEKRFEGAQGLVVDDDVRVTIAAQACLLLLHRDGDVYPDLDTVLVYPHAYVVNATKRVGPLVVEGPEGRLGESWTRGLVVLAWDEVARDVRSARPGRNLVLHEFAHQLDAEDGSVDGAPALGDRHRYAEWARVLGGEFDELHERLRRGLPTDIAAYAGTNPPEFFAVVTELFFEAPQRLRARHPALYDELAAFYRLDPAHPARRDELAR